MNGRDREARDNRERDNAGVGAGGPVSPPGTTGVLRGMAQSTAEGDAPGNAQPSGGEVGSGSVKEAQLTALRQNVWPPFNIERGDYHGITYPGHTPYAVDFNRGWGTTDWNDEVLASAAGNVLSIDPAYGSVWLGHPLGLSTMYAHLNRWVVRVGQHVESAQLLGYIGRRAPAPARLSPHLHYQQLVLGRAVEVQFYGRRYPASLLAVDGIVYGPLINGHRTPVLP